MGTRGFTGFQIDGQTIAAYQQYDAYPDYQGKLVLEFARIAASTVAGREILAERVRSLIHVDESGTPTPEQALTLAEYHENVSTGADWYATLRKCQGRLDLILDSGYICQRSDIFEEEYSWIIDLDEARFYGYSGASQICMFGLEDLPTDAEFLKVCAVGEQQAYA